MTKTKSISYANRRLTKKEHRIPWADKGCAASNLLHFVALLLVMASISCATAKSKKKSKDSEPKAEPAPAWVDSPTSVYPTSAYFQAVGTGADRKSAELSAVNGIAAIFGQNVTSMSHASKRMEQAVKDGKTAVQTTSGIDQDVVSQVDMDNLIGVETKGYWQNVKEGNYMAIAVLDKSKAAAMYTAMIQQNDKEVRLLMDVNAESNEEYFTFETYARFDLSREIAERNEGYLQRLQVINAAQAAQLRDAIVPSKQAQSKALDVAKAIPIGITVEGDKDGRVKGAFAAAVTQAGFRTSDRDGERYMINVSVSLEQHDTKTTVQCRYNVDAPLSDTVMDEVLLPYSSSGRESSKDWEGAQYNTYKALEKKIKSSYAKSFAEYTAQVAAY